MSKIRSMSRLLNPVHSNHNDLIGTMFEFGIVIMGEEKAKQEAFYPG